MRKLWILFVILFVPSAYGASIYLHLKLAGGAAAISNLQGTPLTSTSVRCTWTTDVTTTDNKCYYGTSPNPASTSCSDANNTSHTCDITGLTAQTKYYFNASSTNGSFVTVSSDNNITTPPTALANVAKWICDENTGSTCADQSGNSYTLTFNANAPTWTSVAGRVCDTNAILGNGTNALASASGTKLNNLTQFTVCGVLYCTGWGGGNTGRIVSKESAGGFDDLLIDTDQATGSILVALYNTSGTVFATYGAANSFTLNQRTPVCVTYDDLGDRKIHIYQSGTEVSYGAEPAVTGDLATTNNAWNILNNAGDATGAACTLDNIYIDSGVVSGATITARAGECAVVSGTTYYISPTANGDAGDGLTSANDHAFKTWGFAFSKLHPGDTLKAKANSTWTNLASCTGLPNSGNCLVSATMPNYDCGASSTACNNAPCPVGTAAKHITIQAETERTAVLVTDGSANVTNFMINHCSYIDLIGLRGESQDKFVGGANPSIFDVEDSNIIGLYRLVAAHPNRLTNGNPITMGTLGSSTKNSIVQENEVYAFHRYGIEDYHGDYNVIDRNYVNSRKYPSLKCDGKAGAPTAAGYCNDSWATGGAGSPNYGKGPACSTIAYNGCGAGKAALPPACACASPSRNWAAGDICSTCQEPTGLITLGDACISGYGSTHTSIYNNITENCQNGTGTGNNVTGGVKSYAYGNIAINDWYAVYAGNEYNVDYQQNVSVNNTGATDGAFFIGNANGGVNGDTLVNNTAASTNPASGIMFSSPTTGSVCWTGGPSFPCTVNLTNNLSFGNTGFGIRWNTGKYTSTATSNDTNGNTAGNFSTGSSTVTQVPNPQATTAPTKIGLALNKCIAYVPCGNDGKGGQNPYTGDVANCTGANASNMAGAGNGTTGGRANDIGASIVWEYTGLAGSAPTLSATKLWNQTTGAFPCGATVNDSTLSTNAATGTDPNYYYNNTQACGNVHKRLNIGPDGIYGGCSIP